MSNEKQDSYIHSIIEKIKKRLPDCLIKKLVKTTSQKNNKDIRITKDFLIALYNILYKKMDDCDSAYHDFYSYQDDDYYYLKTKCRTYAVIAGNIKKMINTDEKNELYIETVNKYLKKIISNKNNYSYIDDEKGFADAKKEMMKIVKNFINSYIESPEKYTNQEMIQPTIIQSLHLSNI